MLRPNPSLSSAGAALACFTALGLIAACGPKVSPPPPVKEAPKDAAPAAAPTAAAPTAAAPNKPIALTPQEVKENLGRLSRLEMAPPMKWDLADGVVVTPAMETARTGSFKAVSLTPTGGTGFHRVGLEGDFGDGPKTFHITLWLNGGADTGLKLEARGQTLLNADRAADYATQYFDLAQARPESNPLATDATKFQAASIVKDGDWTKISVDMTTRDGWLYFVIGMTTKGEHVFAGTSGMGLTIGGVSVTPAT